jgi:hypothetical protein
MEEQNTIIEHNNTIEQYGGVLQIRKCSLNATDTAIFGNGGVLQLLSLQKVKEHTKYLQYLNGIKV